MIRKYFVFSLLLFTVWLTLCYSQESACPEYQSIWAYEQSTGVIYFNGKAVGNCYAGAGVHKNRPESESIKYKGPLPQGKYSIGKGYSHRKLGPITMNLEPIGEQNMFKRNLFRIHADSRKRPGQASQGCIVCPRNVRIEINKSKVKTLIVVDKLGKCTEETEYNELE